MKNKRILLLNLFPIILSSCASYWNSDANNYSLFLNQCRANSDFHTQLLIFPDSTNSGTVSTFSYKTTEDLLTGSYFFYLVMTYNQETFDAELTRISEVKATFPEDRGSKTILPYLNQNLYLTIYRDNRYEYAIFNKEKREIAYISNQLYSWTFVNLKQEHRLLSVVIPTELDDGDNSYNMYYYYEIFMDTYVGVYCID